MNQNEFPCIKQVTETVHLTIPLKYTSNEITGVTEILDGWKRQYIPKLQGVVVNYRNIRLSARPFFIHISRTAPRYDVTATFDLFCPSIGDIVKGKINRTSREHIGCLIEGTINATIHLPWDSSQMSKFIRINHDILFQIKSFEFNRHTIRVYGQITPECVKLMEELFPCTTDDLLKNMSSGHRNSKLGVAKDDGYSSINSNESANFSESIEKSPNSKLGSSYNSTATSTYNDSSGTKVQKSFKVEVETEDDLPKNPSPCSSKSKKSRKRKKDSDSSSLNSPEPSKKKKKLKKLDPEYENAKKKKQKEKLKTNSHEESTLGSDMVLNMSDKADLESAFSTFDFSSYAEVLQNIKKEEASSSSSNEKKAKGQKRKHESSTSDIDENAHKKKKKHKSKDSVKQEKSTSSKKKSKLITSGDVLKKDKKKSKKHSSKKGAEEIDSTNVSVSIKSELS